MPLKFRENLFNGPSGNVFRGMLTLAMGTGAARLISIVSIPILTRIYSPADYGVMSVFMAIISVLVPFVTLRYVVAIPLPRTDGIAMNLIALCTLLMLSVSTLVGLALWAFGPWILKQFSMEALVPWYGLIILGVIGAAAYEVLMVWATRRRNYHVIAKTQIFQSSIGEVVKILLGLIGFRPLGLLLGQVFTYSGGISSFLFQFRMDFVRLRAQVSLQRIWFAARYYRGFPTFRLVSHVLMTASGQALIIFSAVAFGSETTGQLGIATMAVALPLSLVGMNVGHALYGEAARLGRKQASKIKALTASTTKRLILLSLPPTAIIGIFGTELFSLVFGAEWKKAGTFASIFSIYLMLQFAAWPIIKVLNIFNDQRVFLQINLIRAVALIAIFSTTWIFTLTDIQMVFLYSIGLALIYVFTIWRVFAFLTAQIKRAR